MTDKAARRRINPYTKGVTTKKPPQKVWCRVKTVQQADMLQTNDTNQSNLANASEAHAHASAQPGATSGATSGAQPHETRPIRVRFAPSPTGKLHIGGARTAIYNWAFARANHGTFILRIDDTDPLRSTEENTQIILRAMSWLGLDWDEGPMKGGAFGPYAQTERHDLYVAAAQKLLNENKAYYCFCTPEMLEADKQEQIAAKARFQGYTRRCRGLSREEAEKRIAQGEPYTIRIKVPLNRGDVHVHDLIHGDVVFSARELDDFILIRSDGTPTYNFATVVDDAAMQITHIIRGDDHLSNTPRQVIVYEALGAQVPMFAHLSMILGTDGKKLSKRHGATSVEEYRDAGYDAEALVNYLALLGWALDGTTTIVPRRVLQEKFSLEHVSKNPSTFDLQKLDWINAQYLQTKSDEDFACGVLISQLAVAGLLECAHDVTRTSGAAGDLDATDAAAPSADTCRGVYNEKPAWWNLLAAIIKPRCTRANQVVEKCTFLFEGTTVTYDEKSAAKHLHQPFAPQVLCAAQDVLAALSSWKHEDIDAALMPLAEKTAETLSINKRKFFGVIRVSQCGNQVSPPLGESMELLGKDVCLARISQALAWCDAHPCNEDE